MKMWALFNKLNKQYVQFFVDERTANTTWEDMDKAFPGAYELHVGTFIKGAE